MMLGPKGEAVGVQMPSPIEVQLWMQALDLKRCPCIPTNSRGQAAYFVARGKKKSDNL